MITAKFKNATSSRNRSLVSEMVRTDFKLRYQGSVLGYLWSLLRPVFLFTVLYVVFTRVVKVGGDIPHYPAYLLLGIVLWTYFVEATTNGMNSIVSRGDLIRKVSIPKYIIVGSTNASALVNFMINMLVVFGFMIISKVPLQQTILLVPIFVLELMVFSLAISFLLASFYVKFRDISHIWEVILQVLFYATPIIYALSFPPLRLAKLMSLSPLTQIFQDIRSYMITPDTLTTREVFGSWVGLLIPVAIVVVTAIASMLYFIKTSKNFAEEL
jgi:ABC-2 type transport system permease protein